MASSSICVACASGVADDASSGGSTDGSASSAAARTTVVEADGALSPLRLPKELGSGAMIFTAGFSPTWPSATCATCSTRSAWAGALSSNPTAPVPTRGAFFFSEKFMESGGGAAIRSASLPGLASPAHPPPDTSQPTRTRCAPLLSL
eukprot:scaffold75336_cov32-Tisochrysis_lutea.AAC.2